MLLAPPLEKDFFYAKMKLLSLNMLDKIHLVDSLYAEIIHSGGDNARIIESGSFRERFRSLVEQLVDQETDKDTSSCRNVFKVRFLRSNKWVFGLK